MSCCDYLEFCFLFFPTGAKLADGIPELRQNSTLSPPSVPSENEHVSCQREVADFPFIATVSEGILNATNSIWGRAKTANGLKYLLYSSENDIVYIVRRFLEDILLALKLPLDFNAEVTIKQVRPDLCVLLLEMYLVGVLEVKKPGGNVLLEPTVLGELLDQMFLVEGFYGMGPVIGILTTGEEWIVSWFPIDDNNLRGTRVSVEGSDATFSTPLKPTSTPSESTHIDRYSPSGGTPSQRSGQVHSIEVALDGPPGDDDNAEISPEMVRLLCTTKVMNVHTDPQRVVQLLCSAFQLMASPRTQYHPGLSRCLLKFHKDIHAVTFHPMPHDAIYRMVDFNKFPNKNVKTLVALEDLGRGSTGKAWLCVTLTKPCSAACVIKFDNKHVNSSNLIQEKKIWGLLYPELSHMIKLEQWSGADALVMPHFSTVLEQERGQYRDEVLEVLRDKFVKSSKVHKDVCWRNIGKYISNIGKVTIVVFDLHDVVDYDADSHNDWVDKAMVSLYATV